MSWTVELDPAMPVSALRRLASVVQEFPGDDELLLVIGLRRLRVPVTDSAVARREVSRVLGRNGGAT